MCNFRSQGFTIKLSNSSQAFLFVQPIDLVYDHTWISFNLDYDITWKNILFKFHEECAKKCGLKTIQEFSFLPTCSNIVVYSTWPSFKLGWDIICIKVLGKLYDDLAIPLNVASTVFTRKMLRDNGQKVT